MVFIPTQARLNKCASLLEREALRFVAALKS